MLSHHKQALIKLFRQCHKIYANPQESGKECLEIQETLIQRLTYIEGRIRERKAAIKILKNQMGQSKIRLSKVEARKAKDKIEKYHYQIDRYQDLAIIYKNVGDALAFSYIDKWDIKPLAMKEAAGSLSRKMGSCLERKILRRVFEIGHIALLNDITNCLRFGDITVPKDGKLILFEAKSSKRGTDRDHRQSAEAESLINFYATDYSERLYGRDLSTKRVGFRATEIHHRDKINNLVLSAIENENSFIEAEDGLFYLASTNFDPQIVEDIFNKCKGKPKAGLINCSSETRFYFPIILTIQNPETLYKFYDGQLSIIVIVDTGVIENKLLSHDLQISFIDNDDEWVAEISRNEISIIKIGSALWSRLYAEFVSLDWFLNEVVVHVIESSLTILDSQLILKET